MVNKRIFYFAIVPALFFQLIGVYLYFVLFKGEDFSQIIYFVTKIALVVWPLIWLSQLRSKFLPFFGGSLKKSIVVGLISGLLIVGVVILLYFLMSEFLLFFVSNVVTAAEGLNFLDHYILFSLFISVIHSFLEEYYWRWFVLNGLMLRLSRTMSIVIASLAFASHHFIVVLQFVPLYLAVIATVLIFLLGVFWSELYLRTKNIVGAWISHFFADVVIMAIGYLLIF